MNWMINVIKSNSKLKTLNLTQHLVLIWIIINFINFTFIEISSFGNHLTRQNVFLLNVILLTLTFIYLLVHLSVKTQIKRLKAQNWQTLSITILFLGSLTSGFAVAPNNWDSMTYHLARVAHWYQNGNLSHFEATVSRQNYISPFGDYQSLVMLSSGSDRFAFIPSLISALIIVCIFYAVCSFLNMPRNLIYTGIFLILAPNFVSQISTTQVDLRSLAFVLIGVYLIVLGGSLSTLIGVLAFSLSFGTKFLSLLPLIGILFIPKLRNSIFKNIKTNPKATFLGFILGVLVNSPWLIRNYNSFGNFTGDSGHIFALKSSFIVRLIDLIRYFATNLMYYEIPVLNEIITKNTNTFLNHFFENNRSSVPFGLNINSVYPIATEDDVSSFILFITFLIIFIFLLAKKKFFYSIVFLVPFWTTFTVLAWQPWVNRLLVSTFVFMIIIGLYFMNIISNINFQRFIQFLSIISLLTSFSYLIDNDRRGLNTIVTNPTDRVTQYFIPRPGLKEDYTSISSFLTSRNIRYVTLTGIEDSWEYPLLVMNPIVTFVSVGSGLANYGVCLDGCEILAQSSNRIELRTKSGLLVYKIKN